MTKGKFSSRANPSNEFEYFNKGLSKQNKIDSARIHYLEKFNSRRAK